jgi:uncharacterized repeat protein (TIGR03803 family)
VIYGFTGLKDGKFPVAGLVVDNKGALYGTTTNGGNFSGNPEGYGVVFRLSYSAGVGWTEGVLHAFQGTDGGDPNSSLLRDSTGAFYGSTYQNGQYGFGSIFKLAPPTSGGGAWTETILYSFQDGNDGGYPVGTPALDSTGAVYGTTSDGGQYGRGNVFKLSPPSGGSGSWTESVLYAFQNGSDGGYPQDGVVLDASGNVYGTTLGGGDGLGVVFELLPPSGGSGAWTEVVLHSFTGGADGGSPYTPVLLLGADLYGTTWSGGTGNGGTVFQIMP